MDLEKMSENLGLPVDTQLDEHIQPLDNTRLEQAIIRVKTQNDRENMMAMMKALTRAELLVCTALTDISREQADGIERGETVRLEGPRSFQPMVLQRADGSCVMPLYIPPGSRSRRISVESFICAFPSCSARSLPPRRSTALRASSSIPIRTG